MSILVVVGATPTPASSLPAFAEAIYQRLARVTADGRQPPPLEVVPDARRRNDRQVAWFDTGSRTIGIDEKTIRLCDSMGANSESCVAFFLGHELAHFYKDHAWGADFGSRFPATPLGASIQQLTVQQRLAFETQADDVGGIYGYLAGYDTLAVAGEALRRVYKEYAIPDIGTGYPSLAERQDIARISQENLKRFIPVFEAGNLLFAIGRYRDAASCFDYIARTLPSREILNNAGVAWALASGVSDVEVYPWLLDAQTRLRVVPRRRSVESPSENERWEMLKSARTRLDDTSRRDPDYLPAVVNLVFVDDLLGRHGTAVDDASHALEMVEKGPAGQGAGPARLGRAIAYIHLGEAKKAEADLAALPDNDPAAAHWKAVATGQSPPPRLQEARQKSGPDETVADQRPQNLVLPNTPPISVQPDLQLRSRSTAQYLALLVSTPGGILKALISRAHDQATARSVRRGSEDSVVREAYGDPSRLHLTASGKWYVYDRPGLVIRFGLAGTVEDWIVYAWLE